MGETFSQLPPFAALEGGQAPADGLFSGNIWGTYVHGIFDDGDFTARFLNCLLCAKGLDKTAPAINWAAYKERQYALLAENVRKSLRMEEIYRILGV